MTFKTGDWVRIVNCDKYHEQWEGVYALVGAAWLPLVPENDGYQVYTVTFLDRHGGPRVGTMMEMRPRDGGYTVEIITDPELQAMLAMRLL